MTASDVMKKKTLPEHIAIIMDGNGRWALKRGLLRQAGHQQGAKAAEEIVRYASELGIKYVTLYAFSSENWQRPQDEVDAVMRILESYLRKDANELVKNDIRIVAIGALNRLPAYLGTTLDDVIEKTKNCKKLVITLALSYGSREEITEACKQMIRTAIKKNTDINSVNDAYIKEHLYTKDLPDPDLLIRTGGEFRLSNFLLLQLSYSELYFCPTLWPDFQRADLDRALFSFSARNRRFGALSND